MLSISSYGSDIVGTDLPPLTLAVVVLEQTLVVGDTVLTEHESIVRKNMSVVGLCINRQSVMPGAFSVAIDALGSRELRD